MNSYDGHWPRVGIMSHEGNFQAGELPLLIQKCQELDLKAVQLGGHLLREAFTHPDIAHNMGDMLRAHNITVAGLAGYSNLVSPDPQKLQANIQFLSQCLITAPLLGTRVVATETGTRSLINEWAHSPDNQGEEAWNVLSSTLQQLLLIAERHNTILALEGYVNNVINTPERMATLLEQFPTQHLQLVLDPFNYLYKSLLPDKERIVNDFLNRFKDRFVLAHLKDVSAEGAERDTPEFGYGVFPHHLYLSFLKDQRPDLPVILEHLPLGHIPDALRKLKALIV